MVAGRWRSHLTPASTPAAKSLDQTHAELAAHLRGRARLAIGRGERAHVEQELGRVARDGDAIGGGAAAARWWTARRFTVVAPSPVSGIF